MNLSRFLSTGIFAFSILALPLTTLAKSPNHPAADPNFLRLSDGRDLRGVKVNGVNLSLAKGAGKDFGSSARALFEKIRRESKEIEEYPVQWALMDLDSGEVLEQSLSSNIKHFGASVSKIFVGAALMDKQNGNLSSSQLQLMSSMLVVSSNTAWTDLQRQIGGGNADRGREAIHAFTQRMGYERTRGFQGWLGNVHGNELTAKELVQFLFDTYHDRYPGAEVVWKVMYTCRTGISRARKYMPASQFVGGKTGTYHGTTVDPETGKSTGPDGKPYTVKVNHHVVVFNVEGRQYGLAILANTGNDESSAALAGGLYKEYGEGLITLW